MLVFFVTGFPIALSYPHFYQADPNLISAVEGSHPDPEKHETFFIIQPVCIENYLQAF